MSGGAENDAMNQNETKAEFIPQAQRKPSSTWMPDFQLRLKGGDYFQQVVISVLSLCLFFLVAFVVSIKHAVFSCANLTQYFVLQFYSLASWLPSSNHPSFQLYFRHFVTVSGFISLSL